MKRGAAAGGGRGSGRGDQRRRRRRLRNLTLALIPCYEVSIYSIGPTGQHIYIKGNKQRSPYTI
jgi:hypothetical protein